MKVGEEVSMLGYNLGPEISSTTAGLKIQHTYGKISQESNGLRVLYSINALPGSSGSPVFSKDGKLVAINYYGYEGEEFNYGILAKHLGGF